MGTTYALINKTKKESCYIRNQSHKYFELFNNMTEHFLMWLLLDNWNKDHVIFVNDGNECDYGNDFYNFTDVSDKLEKEFKEFIINNKWYFGNIIKK